MEKYMPSSRDLYKFYGEPLKEYWKKNRKLKDLYALLPNLHENKKSKSKTVQDQFVRINSLPLGLLKGVLLLLAETDFYLSYFDLGMIPRLEMINSDRVAFQQYKLMKNSTAKEDNFWGRWLTLYEVRYNSDRFNDDAKKEKFEELKRYVQLDYFEREKEMIKKIDKNLYDVLLKRLEIFNYFFALSYYQSYRGWLQNSRYNAKAPKEEITKVESGISATLHDIERYMNKLEKIDAIKENFYFDYRINFLYFKGSQLIGSETKHFKELNNELREKNLKNGQSILDETLPEKSDNLQYRIWHDYYRYLHLQRVAENLILERDYYAGLQQIVICLDLLNKIERKLRGGFSRLLLKIKYQKRGLMYIQNSIEAFLLEKELEEPYGYEYKLHEESQTKRDSSFQKIQDWMKEVRKNIFHFKV